MKRYQISVLLEAFYSDAIEPESAWQSYKSFYNICLDGDLNTMRYMYGVVNMDLKQRLQLRNRIAEKGYELTPTQLDQYIFVLCLAIYDHIDKGYSEREGQQ